MHNEAQNEVFRYSYSATQQEEIRRIREKYTPAREDKLEQLRRLDGSVARKASTAALSAGITGALLLGLGMSCCTVWAGVRFVPGVVFGLAGIALVAAAHPLYRRILRREREKIAPEILRLTEELMK